MLTWCMWRGSEVGGSGGVLWGQRRQIVWIENRRRDVWPSYERSTRPSSLSADDLAARGTRFARLWNLRHGGPPLPASNGAANFDAFCYWMLCEDVIDIANAKALFEGVVEDGMLFQLCIV